MKRMLFIALIGLAGNVSAQQNVLTWDDMSDNETSFRIERKAEACTGPGAFTEIGSVAANVNTFTDSPVIEGQTYCYRVRAAGQGGTFSAYSNTAQRTVPFRVPAPPANLQVK